MKKTVIVLIILLSLVFAFTFLSKSSSPQNPTLPSPIPTMATIESGFCNPQDLDANADFQAAAGNIYATLSIKNISGKKCQIFGSNFILPIFDAKNITVKNQQELGPQTFTLSPDKAVYSQIHYPNGPQCSGPVSQTKISFSYKISSRDSISFKNQNGDTTQNIGICASPTEITQVDVWGISEKPVNQ